MRSALMTKWDIPKWGLAWDPSLNTRMGENSLILLVPFIKIQTPTALCNPRLNSLQKGEIQATLSPLFLCLSLSFSLCFVLPIHEPPVADSISRSNQVTKFSHFAHRSLFLVSVQIFFLNFWFFIISSYNSEIREEILGFEHLDDIPISHFDGFSVLGVKKTWRLPTQFDAPFHRTPSLSLLFWYFGVVNLGIW